MSVWHQWYFLYLQVSKIVCWKCLIYAYLSELSLNVIQYSMPYRQKWFLIDLNGNKTRDQIDHDNTNRNTRSKQSKHQGCSDSDISLWSFLSWAHFTPGTRFLGPFYISWLIFLCLLPPPILIHIKNWNVPVCSLLVEIRTIVIYVRL